MRDDVTGKWRDVGNSLDMTGVWNAGGSRRLVCLVSSGAM